MPPVDHTLGSDSGSFVLATTTKKTELSYRLTSDIAIVPNKLQTYCLKFWAFFANNKNSNEYQYLKVQRNSTPVMAWLLRRFESNYWLYLSAEVQAMMNEYIVLTTETNLNTTVVAIDDTSLSKGRCEKPGWCDFEADFCGFHNEMAYDDSKNLKRLLWLRNQGYASKILIFKSF